MSESGEVKFRSTVFSQQHIGLHYFLHTLLAQRLMRLPGMRETRVLIPGSGRYPGEGNGNPLQYSCLENPMKGGAWQATVHRVAKSRTQLSDFTHSLTHSLIGKPKRKNKLEREEDERERW